MIAIQTPTFEPIDIDAIEDRIRGLTIDQLHARFRECLRLGVESMTEAALCFKALCEHDPDFADDPLSATYLKIARGEIDPHCFWMAQESPGRRTLWSLPVDVQQQIVAEPKVEVFELSPSGKCHTRRVHDLFAAPKDIVDTVIDKVERRVRTIEEQEAYVKAQQAKPSPRPIPVQTFAAEKPNIPRTVRFTESELEAIRLHAAINHLSEGEMIRRFLIRAGAFKRPKT